MIGSRGPPRRASDKLLPAFSHERADRDSLLSAISRCHATHALGLGARLERGHPAHALEVEGTGEDCGRGLVACAADLRAALRNSSAGSVEPASCAHSRRSAGSGALLARPDADPRKEGGVRKLGDRGRPPRAIPIPLRKIVRCSGSVGMAARPTVPRWGKHGVTSTRDKPAVEGGGWAPVLSCHRPGVSCSSLAECGESKDRTRWILPLGAQAQAG